MAAFVAVVPPLATLVITLLPALIPLFVSDIPPAVTPLPLTVVVFVPSVKAALVSPVRVGFKEYVKVAPF